MKYFIVSDIHSFYAELKYSLGKAGFNKRNKDHTLIVCGDIFDRGPDTIGVYKFLSSIPKKRCILIKGNHESLFMSLLTKSFPDHYDFSNGTVKAFCQIANIDEERLNKYYGLDQINPLEIDGADIKNKLINTGKEIKLAVVNHPITAWLKSAQWKNYFELDNYIFVHSFIPLKIKEEYIDQPFYKLDASSYFYNPNGRFSTDSEWEEATWGDPIKLFKAGLFDVESDIGKILVVGHGHTCDFYSRLANITTNTHDIYYSRHLIGIDGGVRTDGLGHLIHPQNILVIDSADFTKCYDKNSTLLEAIDEDLIESKA